VWADEERVEWYKRMEYEAVQGAPPLKLRTAQFLKLRKRIRTQSPEGDLVHMDA
jgi:hypothetical protein